MTKLVSSSANSVFGMIHIGAILTAICFTEVVRAQTCTRDTYGSLPNAPVFPTATLEPAQTPALSALVTDHWSEVAVMQRPVPVTPVASPPQTSCPHLTGSLVDFHTLGFTNGGNVNIPANTRVLVSSCSISSGTVFNKVTIPSTSELIFGDATIHFQARAILVEGGKLLLGSATCRLRNKVTITLHGTRPSSVPADVSTKGIWAVNGTVEMHGALYTPTWTRVAKTVEPGDDLIFVQDMINWQPGQSIVVTTTEIKDSRDYNHNEERLIAQVFRISAHSNVAAIRVTQAFTYKHYGGRAYQAEVGLLSRNILVQGSSADSEPTDTANAICVSQGDSTYPCNDKYLTGYGVHTRLEGPGTIGRLSGVEFFRAGQTNFLGRYAIHFHQVGQTVADGRLFVKDCSVHRSFFRAYAVHGTDNAVISQNVGYDVIGHMYFLEDGIEEHNRFEYNLGAHVHWLGPSQEHDNSFGAQYAFWVTEGPNLILPSDLGASVFYITNSYNYFLGNAASGGFSGFAFVNLPKPVKLNELYRGWGNFSPMSRPLLQFKGNSAHSTAYWNEQAGAVYVGGTLKHSPAPGGQLMYTSGRDLERYTCNVDPSTTWGWCQRPDHAWMIFEDTKMFLANRGMQHWGARSEVIRAEFHDIGMSSNVFGTVLLKDMLVNCRSLEHVPASLCPSKSCKRRDRVFFENFHGFQWYDVGQSHLMVDVEFRNCNPDWAHCLYKDMCGGASTFQILTHSHRYVPEIMQASRGISYTNYNPNTLVKFTVPQDDQRTVSGRLTNWIDWDGSVFPGVYPGVPLILGSAWANSWWKTHTGCVGPRNDLWICPKGQDGVASIYVSYDITKENAVNSGSVCPNGEGSCPVVGTATHFGRLDSEGLEIGQNPKVTGPILRASGGWFIRFHQGSPKSLSIKRAQIHPDDNLVLAFPYPSSTLFTIRAIAPNFCDWARTEEMLVRVNSLAEVRAGFGDRYYFDQPGRMLYIRIVQKNDECFPVTPTIPWQKETVGNLFSFTREGLTLMSAAQEQFRYEILATNCGGSGAYCEAVAPVAVPPAFTTQSPNVPATFRPSLPTLRPTSRPTPPCVGMWALCGDNEYTGCCLDGGVCTYVHEYYKQCQPGAAPSFGPTALPPGVTSAPVAPSSTPSLPPTTKAPSYAPADCAATWAACGGQGHTGPTCCVPEATCVFDSNWYSQCQPRTATGSPTLGAGTTKAPSVATSTKAPSLPATALPTSKAPSSKAPSVAVTSRPSSLSPSAAVTQRPSSKAPSVGVTKRPSSKTPTSKAPTRNPTSKRPTSKAPTRNPTSKRPTSRSPTRAPTSKSPTSKAPTKNPTSKGPTVRPTTKAPSSKAPTQKPPTKTPTSKSPTTPTVSKAPSKKRRGL